MEEWPKDSSETPANPLPLTGKHKHAMEKPKNNTPQEIGTLTLHGQLGTPNRTLRLTDLVRCADRDDRLCTVARAEDNTFLLAVENPASTNRATRSQMYLSEESMLALASCIVLFYEHNGIDISDKFEEIVKSKHIEYEFAPTKEKYAICNLRLEKSDENTNKKTL